MSLRSAAVVVLIASLAAACDAAPPTSAAHTLEGAEFQRTGGCGDAFVYGTNADNTIAVTINWAQAASRAQEAGPFEEKVALPDDRVVVSIQFGQHLSDGFCTDILMPDRPRILAEAQASTGEVQIEVLPAPGAEPFMPMAVASVTLGRAVFEVPVGDGFETWRIESLELRDLQVGWMAG
ncbi:hypothetical protein BH23CHL6_BH23CHL6_13050 [soil metagenome]